MNRFVGGITDRSVSFGLFVVSLLGLFAFLRVLFEGRLSQWSSIYKNRRTDIRNLKQDFEDLSPCITEMKGIDVILDATFPTNFFSEKILPEKVSL
ncbi:hypothetical protein [Butyrivibrio sp. FC2001]|uniref:hypothetical protein n=1 Tax=Butyrivibrio sp. FC2001 TaxID=1280671 RepID=UPI001A99585A|nr:hypothetical protein [Butyrivibrio sp. FC2001]